jgi:hypothetical protein
MMTLTNNPATMIAVWAASHRGEGQVSHGTETFSLEMATLPGEQMLMGWLPDAIVET